ncbi:hypothetical protein [Maricaulis maris]|uniref:Uncharacterized protein n=1 Tax=Maricaulis maris TaxID=74318 RepID=A0A495CZD6_9PROT|nr:hypothetical protein [Maricaulis maris]RKQ89582.1 hypothetical protein C7435_3285 [Maricaulis maris]
MTVSLMLCGCQQIPAVAETPAQNATPSTAETDLKAAARLERVNADLLASTSATLTLEKWCADHNLASPATIAVEHAPPTENPITDAQRTRLQIGPDTEVRYRNVKLKCGDRTLSEAENWYVPSRLTAEMNTALTETKTPYGKVIRPLAPRRQTFALDRGIWLDAQLAPSGKMRPEPSAPPCQETVFSHSALVLSGDNTPLAEVRENYKMELVCFDPLGASRTTNQ